jgi:hypothetical protein
LEMPNEAPFSLAVLSARSAVGHSFYRAPGIFSLSRFRAFLPSHSHDRYIGRLTATLSEMISVVSLPLSYGAIRCYTVGLPRTPPLSLPLPPICLT